jgi:hypothetical protein
MGRDHFPNIPVGAGMGFARGVLLLDDCEGTFTWNVTGTGGDDVHAFATAAAFQGTYGMRLKTRTTATAAADNLTVTKIMGYPESGLLVTRLRFASPDWTTHDTFGLLLNVYNGVHNFQAALMYTPATPEWGYTDSTGAYVVLATLTGTIPNLAWVQAEIVLDLRTMTWLQVAANGTRVDLAGVAMRDVGADVNRDIYLAVQLLTVGAAAAEIYADNIYVGEYLES